MIYEGTREIHKIMQADYALGYRQDKPRRVELPAYKRSSAVRASETRRSIDDTATICRSSS